MSDLILRDCNGSLDLAKYNSASPQLGTADWIGRSSPAFRQFKVGDFWLGRHFHYDIGLIGTNDDRHVLLVSGTRGGKGTSVIVPNLCRWLGSVVVIDPKGENAVVTARRRGRGSEWSKGMGQKVHILDPFNVVNTPEDNFADVKSSFNPLDALSESDDQSIDIAFNIAAGFMANEKSSDPFWDESATDLNAFVMLHVATAPEYADHERHLITVRRLIVAGDTEAAKFAALVDPAKPSPSGHSMLFASMQRNPAFDGRIANAGFGYADLESKSPKLFGSISKVAEVNTRFLDSPGMKSVVLSSTFSLSDLKTDGNGVSLYLCLPQRYMTSHFRWLRMMVTLITAEMERVKAQPACGHSVLMVLDEFPALQRMKSLENAAAQIAGYGVKLVFVAQTLAQLKDIYKDNWETLLANAGTKLFFCNDDYFTREYVSKYIGDREVTRYAETASETRGHSTSQAWGTTTSRTAGWSHSSTGAQGSFGINGSSTTGASFTQTFGQSVSHTIGVSGSVHKRPLITPDEVGRRFGDRADPKAILLVSGFQPLAFGRVSYQSSDLFAGEYDWHPDHNKPRTHAQHKAYLHCKMERERREADAGEERRRARIAEINRQKDIEAARSRKLENIYETIIFMVVGAVTGPALVKLSRQIGLADYLFGQ